MAVHPIARYIPAIPNATWRYDKQREIYERELSPMSTIITAQEAKPAQTQPKRHLLRWIAAIVGGMVLLLATWFGFMLYRMNYVPSTHFERRGLPGQLRAAPWADRDQSDPQLDDPRRYAGWSASDRCRHHGRRRYARCCV
jgi:hypothetical protein